VTIKRSERRRRYVNLPDSKALLADLIGETKVRKFGFDVIRNPQQLLGGASVSVLDQWKIKGQERWFKDVAAAVQYWILQHPRTYGKYKLSRKWNKDGQRISGRWILLKADGIGGASTLAEWVCRPTRKAMADIIRHQRSLNPGPSHMKPDTLGWRGWAWDTRNSCLKSPAQGTLWDCGPELRVPNWDESSAVRGRAGIHACRLPRGDWRMTHTPSDFMGSDVIGLVERFGKFVLGSEGWRAEWVIIRELLVCDEVTATHVRAAYPEIPVGVAPKGHWLRKGEY
jgi:hypothetical protein